MIQETSNAGTGAPQPPWASGCPAGQHNLSDVSERVNVALSNQGGERMVEEGRTGRCWGPLLEDRGVQGGKKGRGQGGN